MRIDAVSPTPAAVPQAMAREARPTRAPLPADSAVKDHVEMQPKPEVNSTNILVEMQPGNILVYKFIDESSGRLIQQIPSEQMLNLSQFPGTGKSNKRT